jgi:hypothetical protein
MNVWGFRVSTVDFLPLQQLTFGGFEVTDILGWDEASSTV